MHKHWAKLFADHPRNTPSGAPGNSGVSFCGYNYSGRMGSTVFLKPELWCFSRLSCFSCDGIFGVAGGWTRSRCRMNGKLLQSGTPVPLTTGCHTKNRKRRKDKERPSGGHSWRRAAWRVSFYISVSSSPISGGLPLSARLRISSAFGISA